MGRRILLHGSLVVMLSLLLGFAVAGAPDQVHGRVWLAAHNTGILTGLIVIAAGLLWPTLRLGARGQKVAAFMLLTGAWVGYWLLGVFGAALSIPQKVAAPSLPPAPAWATGVTIAAIAYVTITILGGWGMIVYGLRGRE
jgi:hypothetical protein